MDLLLLMNIQHNMEGITGQYGAWIYLIFFLLIFLEAGIVFTPFLPGNTLLFIAGALAASGHLNLGFLVAVFVLAAVACDSANYWLGRSLGQRIFRSRYLQAVRGDYIERTHRFYERHGYKAIVPARFIPYLRTFSPFLAGTVAMPYPLFVEYDAVAGLSWTVIFLMGGYYFGNLTIVQNSIGLLVYGFIILTVLTAIAIGIKLFQVIRSSPEGMPHEEEGCLN